MENRLSGMCFSGKIEIPRNIKKGNSIRIDISFGVGVFSRKRIYELILKSLRKLFNIYSRNR